MNANSASDDSVMSQVAENSSSPQVEPLSPLAERILDLLSKEGQLSNRKIRGRLGCVSDTAEYDRAKEQLLLAGRVVRGQGFSGVLRLPLASAPLPDVDSDALEEAKSKQAPVEEAPGEKAERDLYPYVKQWAENSAGLDNVYIIGDLRRREVWENPDLLAYSVNDFKWLVGYEIEVTTFEVKLALDIYAVWQAAHYRRFSNYVYLACYEAPDVIRNRTDGRLYRLAVEFGLGVLSLTPSGQGAKGVKCVEINSPGRQLPQSTELDAFLQDYEDVIGLPGRAKKMWEQLRPGGE